MNTDATTISHTFRNETGIDTTTLDPATGFLIERNEPGACTITLDADGTLTYLMQGDETLAYAFVNWVELGGAALEKMRRRMEEGVESACSLALFHVNYYPAESARAIVTLEQFEADFAGRHYPTRRWYGDYSLKSFIRAARKYSEFAMMDGVLLRVDVTPTDNELAAMHERYLLANPVDEFDEA
jgi:hypothetical protein